MKAKPGTTSHGTLRPEDLIRTHAALLVALFEDETDLPFTDACDVAEAVSRAHEWLANPKGDGGFIMRDLFDALDLFTPDGYWFGTHPGDGSNFGFWPNELKE